MSREPSSSSRFPELTTGRFAVVLALLVFVAYAEVLVGDRTATTNDLWYFGYPLAHHLKASLANGELPLWNPLSECGIPFLAQWNTLVLYPGSLFYILFPLDWALTVFSVLHLYLGGMGAWFLVRYLVREPAVAAIAGAVYAFNGFTQACMMWPNNAAALGWAPWVWWLVIAGSREGGRRLLVGAVAGALQMLTGAPEIILATWLLVGGGVLLDDRAVSVDRRLRLARLSGMAALVALLAAAQLAPFLDLLTHSPRSGGDNDTSWPIHPLGLVNYLMPLFNTVLKPSGRFTHHQQGWIHSYYLGGAVLWLVVLGLWRTRGRIAAWIGAALGIAWLMAMGEHVGLQPALAKILPLGFTRFPSKFLIVPALVLPFVAAQGFRIWLRTSKDDRSRVQIVVTLLTLMLVGTAYAVMAERPLENQDHGLRLANGRERLLFTVMGIGLIWLLARLKDARAFRLAMGGLAVVLWLDYQRHQPAVMETAPRELLRLPHPVLAEIGPEVRQRRARMALLGQTQLENAFRNKGTGEETLLYARLDQFLNLNLVDGVMKFDGFFALWFAEQDDLRRVLHSMSATGLRPGLADFLGIAYTTSTESPLVWNARPTARPLVTAGQEPVFETATDCVERLSDPAFDSSRIASLRPGAREWVEASGTTNARVELTRFDAHEVAFTVTTDVPTLAVIAQGFYHPWKPTIDGKPARLLRANHAYQAVSVPGGRSEVRLRYVDNAFRLGLALSIVGLVLLGLLWWRWRPLAAEHPA